MKDYPRIGKIEKRPKNTCAKCSICENIGTKKVHIQISFFRGEDEVTWACDQHAYPEYVERLLYS